MNLNLSIDSNLNLIKLKLNVIFINEWGRKKIVEQIWKWLHLKS